MVNVIIFGGMKNEKIYIWENRTKAMIDTEEIIDSYGKWERGLKIYQSSF